MDRNPFTPIPDPTEAIADTGDSARMEIVGAAAKAGAISAEAIADLIAAHAERGDAMTVKNSRSRWPGLFRRTAGGTDAGASVGRDRHYGRTNPNDVLRLQLQRDPRGDSEAFRLERRR